MRRLFALATIVWMTMLGFAAPMAPAKATTSGPNGQIAFFRSNADDNRPSHTYTMNPDGTDQRALFPGPDTEHPRWSPDGTEIAMECDSCGGAALIVDPDSGDSRIVPRLDPTLDIGCFAWSPDGSRLACAGFDDANPSREGIYTIRSSDGGDLTRVTSQVGIPGDYSPDGKRLSFVGDFEGDGLHIYVVNLDGSGLTPVTPTGMPLSDEIGGSWSPTGDTILFQARPAPDHRFALWTVNADGSGLRQLPISNCGGAFADPRSIGCGDAVWSPDGTRIAFVRIASKTHQKNIFTVNTDGTGLVQVTRTGFQDFGPDWGVHPLTG